MKWILHDSANVMDSTVIREVSPQGDGLIIAVVNFNSRVQMLKGQMDDIVKAHNNTVDLIERRKSDSLIGVDCAAIEGVAVAPKVWKNGDYAMVNGRLAILAGGEESQRFSVSYLQLMKKTKMPEVITAGGSMFHGPEVMEPVTGSLEKAMAGYFEARLQITRAEADKTKGERDKDVWSRVIEVLQG